MYRAIAGCLPGIQQAEKAAIILSSELTSARVMFYTLQSLCDEHDAHLLLRSSVSRPLLSGSALAGLAERGIIQEERPPFCRLGYNMTGCLAFVALTRFLSQFCKYELLLPNLQHRCQFWNPGLSICRPCLPLMKVAKA